MKTDVDTTDIAGFSTDNPRQPQPSSDTTFGNSTQSSGENLKQSRDRQGGRAAGCIESKESRADSARQSNSERSNTAPVAAGDKTIEQTWPITMPMLTITLIMVLAAIVRFAHLGYDSLDHAEAFRANWQFDGNLEQMRRFAPLQLTLGWFTQHFVGRGEWILRFPYALAGLACVYVLYRIASRYVSQGAGLCTAAIAAGHPVLVFYSQKIKVFSLEALMTALLIGAGLSVYKKGTRKSLIGFVVIAILGLGLTFTSSLVIVAWLILFAFDGLRRNRKTGYGLQSLLTTAVILLIVGTAWFLWLHGNADRERMISYYIHSEIGWPADGSLANIHPWIGKACFGALQYVLGVTLCWPPLNWIIGAFGLLTITAAINTFRHELKPLGTVSVLLFALTLLAAILHFWPFGNLRHVTFLIPLTCLAVGCGLWELIRRFGRSTATAFLIAVCVAIPYARAVKATVIAPKISEHTRPIFEYITEHKKTGDVIFAYYSVGHAAEFYWTNESTPLYIQPGNHRGNLKAFACHFDEWISKHPRVWFVFAHNWQNEQEEWIGHLKQTYHLLDQVATQDASGHLFTQRGTAQARIPHAAGDTTADASKDLSPHDHLP